MSEGYAFASAAMRYVFLFVLVYFIAVLVLRSVSEYRYLRSAQRTLKLAIRYVEVLEPSRYRGKRFRLLEVTRLGSGADCEIALPKSRLKASHARIALKKGEYRFSSKQKRYCEINGQPLIRRETPLADGDVVWVQDVCFVCRKNRRAEVDEDA